MKKIIICLLLIKGISTYSQQTIIYPTTLNLKDDIFNNPNLILRRNASFDNTFWEVKNEKNKDISRIKGSPYKNKKFIKAVVKFNEKILDSIYYRINTYQNEIEIKKQYGDSVYFKINKVLGLKIIEEDKQYEVRALKLKNKGVQIKVVENLYPNEGELLFEFIDTKFKEGKTATTSMVKSTKDQFISSNNYYFKLGGKELIKIENKKKFLNRIDNSHNMVKKFIKNEKINLSNDKHLIKLLKYVSTLNANNQ